MSVYFEWVYCRASSHWTPKSLHSFGSLLLPAWSQLNIHLPPSASSASLPSPLITALDKQIFFTITYLTSFMIVMDCRDKSSTKGKNYSSRVKTQAAAVVCVTFQARWYDVITRATAKVETARENNSAAWRWRRENHENYGIKRHRQLNVTDVNIVTDVTVLRI